MNRVLTNQPHTVLSNSMRREEYNSFLCSSKEYDVEGFDVTEYLHRYKFFILTSMNLGGAIKTHASDEGDGSRPRAVSNDASTSPLSEDTAEPAARSASTSNCSCGTGGDTRGDSGDRRASEGASGDRAAEGESGCSTTPDQRTGDEYIYLDGIHTVGAGSRVLPRTSRRRSGGGSPSVPDEDVATEPLGKRQRRRPRWIRKLFFFT